MQTTVTATPTHSGATVAFKDGDDTALTNPVTLAVGANVIKAVVTAEDTTTMKTYMVTVTRAGTTDTLVTIEAEHESIGAGLEDLLFTLTRAGDTTDALAVKVTITQAQTWLGNSDLEHDVTFSANSATAELTITASNFSFTPSTTGNLTATVSGDDIDGGSDTVQIISTSGPPITISYEESDTPSRRRQRTRPSTPWRRSMRPIPGGRGRRFLSPSAFRRGAVRRSAPKTSPR